MKHLNTYITEYIIKKKLDNPIYSEDNYKYFPETKQELIYNVKELFDKGETNLNCICTSEITDMCRLFESYENINFDISGWDVSNVKDMSYMFFGCKLFDCDLSGLDVYNVENMRMMFGGCHKFEGKGLDKWNVSNVIDMCSMFENCENLNCNLSNWDVRNVKDMNYMFYKCKKFNCNLSKWDVSKVKDMNYTFDDCTSLKNKPSWYEE